MASVVRTVLAILAWSACTAIGAAVGAGAMLWTTPSGGAGLLAALFVLPFYGTVGAVVGGLVGVWPAVLVLRAMRVPEPWEPEVEIPERNP